jgi:RHS repeat-associated protein
MTTRLETIRTKILGSLILCLEFSVPATAGFPVADRSAFRARAVVLWSAVAAAVLLSLLLGMVLMRGLAGSHSSVVAATRSGEVSRTGLLRLPLAAQGQVSGALGGDGPAYRVSASGDGFRAVSPEQRLRVRFGRSGVWVGSDGARLGLSLRAVGFGASLRTVGDVMPRARANRVVYGRAGLNEWYANGPLGLEQGFTIPGPPAGYPVGPLTLSMVLSGDMHAALTADGKGLTLSHAGGPSLRYGGLVASDAQGRTLRSWLVLDAGRVLLRVNTRGARYPLRIDPVIQQGEKITGSGEAGEGELGYSVALSSEGNTALVGGPSDNSEAGAVWVFTHSGGVWTQQGEKLTGGGEKGAGRFGTSVALSSDGNTALVGGPLDSSDVGAVWVFTRSGGKWTQQGEKLTGGGEVGEGRFGGRVALSSDGNTALIGGESDHPGFQEARGAAWVFTRSEGKWAQQGEKLTGGSEVTQEGEFGSSVALSADGNTALIGGRGNGTPYYEHFGAAWVFTRSEGKWTQQGSKLTGGGGTYYPEFGYSVALSADGNTALIGGPKDGFAGAAWVFTRSEGKWAQQGEKFTPITTANESEFGFSVALSSDGNTALIGGWAEEPGSNTGAAWIYTRWGSEWLRQGQKITGGGGSGYPKFGYSVALSSEASTALIGGIGDNSDVGAMWAFTYIFSPQEEYGPENPGTPHQPHCMIGSPVNCATGNQVESQTDMAVGGRGLGLRLSRTYNSQLATEQSVPGPFGYGWTGSYSAHLVVNEAEETATVYQDNGSDVIFNLTSSKTYVASSLLVQATLVKEGSTYVYTLANQDKLDFNSAGRLMSETDRNENSITMSYNSKGQLESATDGAGRKLTFLYSEGGQVESVTDPMGHVVKYTYESGNLASVTQPGETSLRWRFEYDSSHELTRETDGRGNVTKTEYDSYHRVHAQIDPKENIRRWQYAVTSAGEPKTTLTEPGGAVTVEEFNLAGLPTSITHASGTSIAQTTTYGYDGSYNLIAVTDPNEHTTKYGYDAVGDRTSSKDANGNETKWTYDGTHDLETMTTPKGETTTIKRDSHGNPEVIERPAPGGKTQKITYKYDSHGDVTSETDPLERTRTYEYDVYGDRESETDPEADKRTWKYNEDSQEIATVSPRGNVKGAEASKFTTKIERDAQGRPLTVTDPLGHTTKDTYDGDGNLETLTDGNGHTTKYTYDGDNELTKIETTKGTVMETGYDDAGQVISQTDANKHTTKYERNLLEEVTEEVDPLGRKTVEEYDPAGNITKVTDPAKRTTTYTYDPGNRLTEVVYSDGKTPNVKYEYDKDGDRTKTIDGTGTTTYTYDQLDRLTEDETGHKETIKYEYDLANEQTKITYPNGKAVTYAYDKAGRLQKATDWLSNVTKFGYNADSEPNATTFPTGTSEEDKYAYNEADQMVEVKMNKGTETLASLVYTRDNDGQVKGTTTKGLPGEESTTYTYNLNNEVNKAASVAYEYDAANDPTKIASSTYKYDKANELESSTGFTYTYNEMGQRTKTTPTAGPVTTYGYDQAGNLASASRPKEGEVSAIEDTYAYDGSDLRASQTGAGKTTYLVWDVAENPPLLLNDGINSYIYGPGNIPFEQINNSTGAVLYLHHDQQGSTRLLTGSTGAKEASFTYDAYGNTTGTTGTASTSLGYDSEYTSNDTGLLYLRARVYDPKTAQFLSVDPLVKLTRAPYTYAGDNPLNNEDPTGLAWQVCVGGSFSIGSVTLGGDACYVSTPGGSGVTLTGSAAGGVGFGFNVHAGAGASNACTPGEYGGVFGQVGGSATGLVGGYGTGFSNVGIPGHNRTVVGGTGGVTVGLGAEAGGGVSDTAVIGLGSNTSGACGCSG